MNKAQILELITKLPSNINEEDVMENLFFKSHVQAGLNALAEGNSLTHEQVKKKFKLNV